MKPLPETSELEAMLNRYLDGETSLEEEKQLLIWFSTNEVPQHLMSYRMMLGFFADERQITHPDQEPTITLKGQIANYKQGKPRRLIYIWSSVAAVLVLMAVGLRYMHQQQLEAERQALLAKQNEMSVESFGQIADALILVSETLHKGMAPVAKAAEATKLSSSDNATTALGSALLALNKVTTILMPAEAVGEEISDTGNSEI